MLKIRWARSDDWRQARAVESGESCPREAEQEITPETLRALPENLRELFFSGGCLNGDMAVGISTDSAGFPSIGRGVEFRRDADAPLKVEPIADMIRAACVEAERIERDQRKMRVQEEQERIAQREVEAKEKALREAAEAADEDEKQAWIKAHGSPRLQLLLDERIDCDVIYRDERLAFERPGWTYYANVCGKIESVKGTSVHKVHFVALLEARKTVPDAKLSWLGEGDHAKDCRCECEEEEIGDGSKVVHQRVVLEADFLHWCILKEIKQ